MAVSILRQLQQEYVQSLIEEGIVNDQFCRIQHSKISEDPDYMIKLIDAYCIDMETILLKLSKYTDIPNADFSKVVLLGQQLEEKSSYIGADYVKLACDDLIQACHEKDEKNFIHALNWTRSEFHRTQNKLEAFVQMERKIIRLRNKQG
ncbi:hypothetical protein K2173_021021 [Erythroxylum novogranatense]|uniref:Histidine-containing phosphotransfer protein n=1 Tax=Erythroxylum novogranatense TaxID=1862640 RepID=A0AAV8TMF9_9ROSI|nr:hypothetical protein K2173_021021 [Erythroxylum novogranatense]